MDILEKKLINYKDESFDGKDGKRVDRHTLLTETLNPETSWESELQVSIPAEVAQKHKLNDPKVLDTLRGKKIALMGNLYDTEQGYTDASGNPRTKKYLRFKCKDIAFDKKSE